MKIYKSCIHVSEGGVLGPVGGVSARSRKCGGMRALDLGWLGTIYKQSTMSTYNYV